MCPQLTHLCHFKFVRVFNKTRCSLKQNLSAENRHNHEMRFEPSMVGISEPHFPSFANQMGSGLKGRRECPIKPINALLHSSEF